MKLSIEQHQKIESDFSALISKITGRKITALIIPCDGETISFSIEDGGEVKHTATQGSARQESSSMR